MTKLPLSVDSTAERTCFRSSVSIRQALTGVLHRAVTRALGSSASRGGRVIQAIRRRSLGSRGYKRSSSGPARR